MGKYEVVSARIKVGDEWVDIKHYHRIKKLKLIKEKLKNKCDEFKK